MAGDSQSHQGTSRTPAAEVRLAFATTIAGARQQGMHVGADNKTGHLGWLPPRDLVDAGVCWCIKPAPDMVVLDADADQVDDEHRAIDTIVELLAGRGIEAVVIASSGTDSPRRHLFARVQNHQLRREATKIAEQAGIDARNGGGDMIRPPGTPHRTGEPPVLLSHDTWEDALGGLVSTDEAHHDPASDPAHMAELSRVVAASATTTPTGLMARLPERAAAKLRQGDLHGDHRGDSETGQSVICAAVNAGMGLDQIRALFAERNNAGARSYHKRLDASGCADADRWLRHSYETAVKGTRGARRHAERGHIATVAEAFAAQEHELDSATANSVVTVFAAVCDQAHAWWHPDFGTPLSNRTLAERSGRTTKTVRRALETLTGLGWLSKSSEHRPDLAARYLLGIPARFADEMASALENPQLGGPQSGSEGGDAAAMGQKDPTSSHMGGVRPWGNAVASVSEPGHDAFASGSLGPGAWRVLRRLHDVTPMSPRDVAAATGTTVRTAQRHITRLAAAGLCHRVDGGWVASGASAATVEVLLVRAARRGGTWGRRMRLEERHRVERQARRDALAEDPERARRLLGALVNADRRRRLDMAA
ncbi:MAG: hypothetical protein GY882_10530 [Actinomycetia bacterium]|nr:hypothetical protein [Actinomycetes bacterium]